MMEGIMGKVMAGWMSLTALMFSSYTGNDPVFKPLECKLGQNYMIVTARLNKAFDNDFRDVFNCGKQVVLNYKIEVRRAGETVRTSTYRHSVTYDPMTAAWELVKSETRQTDIITTYQQLLEEISELECSIPRDMKWREVEIRAEAWLQPVDLPQSGRTVDLMVLWKYKRPFSKKVFSLLPTS
jgi:hypothetical protein